jgi:hypothetical protein
MFGLETYLDDVSIGYYLYILDSSRTWERKCSYGIGCETFKGCQEDDKQNRLRSETERDRYYAVKLVIWRNVWKESLKTIFRI